MINRKQLKLYFIMGSNNCIADPLEVLEQALQGGITLFQFREKGNQAKTGEEKAQLARQMKQLCARYQVPFLINDDIDLAIEIGADGVHVGQEDEHILKVKERCPDRFTIGVSATNRAEAIQAMKDGADYIGAGPVFATSTKEDAKKPIGLDGIRKIKQQTGETPLVAIGGISRENAGSIIEAGADGVSLISAISQANQPQAAAKELRERVEAAAARL